MAKALVICTGSVEKCTGEIDVQMIVYLCLLSVCLKISTGSGFWAYHSRIPFHQLSEFPGDGVLAYARPAIDEDNRLRHRE